MSRHSKPSGRMLLSLQRHRIPEGGHDQCEDHDTWTGGTRTRALLPPIYTCTYDYQMHGENELGSAATRGHLASTP